MNFNLNEKLAEKRDYMWDEILKVFTSIKLG